jgi:hypothetical protein
MVMVSIIAGIVAVRVSKNGVVQSVLPQEEFK